MLILGPQRVNKGEQHTNNYKRLKYDYQLYDNNNTLHTFSLYQIQGNFYKIYKAFNDAFHIIGEIRRLTKIRLYSLVRKSR